MWFMLKQFILGILIRIYIEILVFNFKANNQSDKDCIKTLTSAGQGIFMNWLIENLGYTAITESYNLYQRNQQWFCLTILQFLCSVLGRERGGGEGWSDRDEQREGEGLIKKSRKRERQEETSMGGEERESAGWCKCKRVRVTDIPHSSPSSPPPPPTPLPSKRKKKEANLLLSYEVEFLSR